MLKYCVHVKRRCELFLCAEIDTGKTSSKICRQTQKHQILQVETQNSKHVWRNFHNRKAHTLDFGVGVSWECCAISVIKIRRVDAQNEMMSRKGNVVWDGKRAHIIQHSAVHVKIENHFIFSHDFLSSCSSTAVSGLRSDSSREARRVVCEFSAIFSWFSFAHFSRTYAMCDTR